MLTDAHGDVGIHVCRQIAERLDGVLLQDAVEIDRHTSADTWP